MFCLPVLEHAKRPWLAVQEIIRVTKPGGTIRIDWPFLQPGHGHPHQFFNATPKGNRSAFEERCDIVSCDVRPWQHPIFALSWMVNEWRNGLPAAESATFCEMKIGGLLRGGAAAVKQAVLLGPGRRGSGNHRRRHHVGCEEKVTPVPRVTHDLSTQQAPPHPFGRSTTLVHLSFLSRNVL